VAVAVAAPDNFVPLVLAERMLEHLGRNKLDIRNLVVVELADIGSWEAELVYSSSAVIVVDLADNCIVVLGTAVGCSGVDT
jgi:hypothetical protein